MRHFIDEINGRPLTIFTDHKPILGSWKNQDLQAHDSVALNAMNEIGQWTNDIQYKPGKELVVPDLLSRPFGSNGGTSDLHPGQESTGTRHPLGQDPESTGTKHPLGHAPESTGTNHPLGREPMESPDYIPPEATLAALQ